MILWTNVLVDFLRQYFVVSLCHCYLVLSSEILSKFR